MTAFLLGDYGTGLEGCCGLGTCKDPTCYLCTVIAKLPQPRSSIRAMDEQAADYAEPDAVPTRPCRDPSKIKRTRKAIVP